MTKPTIIFDDLKHKYFLLENGEKKEKPSVTHVIGSMIDKSNILTAWAAKVTAEYSIEVIRSIIKGELKVAEYELPELFKKIKSKPREKKDKAADIGTMVHGMIENYAIRKEVPVSFPTPESESAFKAFITFSEKEQLGEVIANERPIYLSYGVCGTLDKIQMKGGKKYLLDYKTSNYFKDIEMAMQLSVYAAGFEEMTEEKIEGIGVLRLDKETGKPEWRDYTKYRDAAFHLFLPLLDGFNAKKDLEDMIKSGAF